MTRVLHVLDHSLPVHSGYTFRTRAILKAQEAKGLEVRGMPLNLLTDGVNIPKPALKRLRLENRQRTSSQIER